MIFHWIIIYFILDGAYCDEHIARELEPSANEPNLPLNIPPKEDIVARQEVEKSDEIPLLPVKESPKSDIDLSQKLLAKERNDAKLPSGGINTFRESSYVTFTVLVGTRSIDCYYYKARKSFDIDFQVLRGGDFDIGLAVFDINGKRVAFHKPAVDGSLKIVVPPELIDTHYSICLDNQQTSWHVKKVFIMLDVEGPNGINHPDVQANDFGKIENHINKLDLMHSALTSVYQSLINIEHLQSKTRMTEAIDRSIMESNFEYVTLWAIIQIALMMFVSALQVFMIRGLFDSRDGVGAKFWSKLNNLTGQRF